MSVREHQHSSSVLQRQLYCKNLDRNHELRRHHLQPLQLQTPCPQEIPGHNRPRQRAWCPLASHRRPLRRNGQSHGRHVEAAVLWRRFSLFLRSSFVLVASVSCPLLLTRGSCRLRFLFLISAIIANTWVFVIFKTKQNVN